MGAAVCCAKRAKGNRNPPVTTARPQSRMVDLRVLTIPDAALWGKVARSPAKRVTEDELCLALRWKENERKVNSLVRHSPKGNVSWRNIPIAQVCAFPSPV
jgi:hypothetical protein